LVLEDNDSIFALSEINNGIVATISSVATA
jgi:hypothetical protein